MLFLMPRVAPLAFAVLASTAAPAADGLFNWHNVAIHGMGTVTGIAISPLAPYYVYIRTDVGGAYRYNRAGDRWVPLFDQTDTNFTGGNAGLESIAIDPSNAATLYAAGAYINGSSVDDLGRTNFSFAGEVLVSRNAGASWAPTGLAVQNIVVGPNQNFRATSGERLAVDPANSGIVYFASRANGVWSKNGSANWAQVRGGLPDPSTLTGYTQGGDNSAIAGYTFVLFDQHGGTISGATATIYAGAYGSGVWRSQDAGATWTNTGGNAQPLRGALGSDGTLYVGFDNAGQNGAVMILRNGAWTDISPAGSQSYNAIAVDPTNPATVMAGTYRTVYRSTNSGGAWSTDVLYMGAYDTNVPTSPVNPSAPGYYQDYSADYIAALAIDPSDPKQAWWTNGFGVARADDVTLATPQYNWHMTNLEELDSYIVRVPPLARAKGGADVISGTADMIGFRHASRYTVPTQHFNPVGIPVNPAYAWANGNWTTYPSPFPHVASGTSLDYAYKQPSNLAFVGFHQWQNWPVYGSSSDNGQTWTAFPSVPSEMLWSNGAQYLSMPQGGQIAMSPVNPRNMVWAPALGAWPHYTKDAGATWTLAYNLDHGPQPSPYDPQNNNDVHYADLPTSWPNTISPWHVANILAADRADPQGLTFYYFDGWTFYASVDGGANWSIGAAYPSLPDWIAQPEIVSNPAKQGDVWMAFTRDVGTATTEPLYHSTDGGKTFAPVATVDSCQYLTFGRGTSASLPAIYIFGRVGGATADTMYVSTDGASTWRAISDPALNQFPGITFMEADMRTANLVYVALGGRGVTFGQQ